MDSVIMILLSVVGMIVQVLFSLNKVIKEKKFDLNFWWQKNKVATIASIVGIAAISIYLNMSKGTDIAETTNWLVDVLLGFVVNGSAFHFLRDRTPGIPTEASK